MSRLLNRHLWNFTLLPKLKKLNLKIKRRNNCTALCNLRLPSKMSALLLLKLMRMRLARLNPKKRLCKLTKLYKSRLSSKIYALL